MTIVKDYIARTPRSKALADSAATVLADGVSTDSRVFSPYGIFVERGAGTRKWDVDGNEYLDYFGGHGALMLAHCHPDVTAAIQDAAGRGIQFAASSPQEVEWATLIQRHFPAIERLRFTGSGTEATLLALRIARAYSGKSKILRVATHYHGWHDFSVSGYATNFNGSAAPGVLQEIAANTILIRPNDEQAVRAAIRAHKDELAAVIMEPTGSHFGLHPTSDSFLLAAFAEAKANGVLTILDEVISGFRVSLSGYQGVMGLTPDLTCLGKVAAGGMPGGIVGGSEEIMAVVTRDWAQNHGGRVFHQGTFTGNPVTASAAIATISTLEALDGCGNAAATAQTIRTALNALFRDMNTNWHCYGRFSSFHILPDAPEFEGPAEALPGEVFANRSTQKLALLRMALLLEGADISSRGSAFVSAVHDQADVTALLAIFERAMTRLKAEGIA